MSKMNLHIESVDPKSLGESELKKIAEVEKDLWAYGIGEYVKCKNCGLIHSKNDIFGHLSSEIRIECVTKLEEIFAGDVIKCKNCDSETEFIYDVNKNIIDIKNRLFNSKESFVSLLLNMDNGDIKGFTDGYIDDIEKIFYREFFPHYGYIGLDYFKNIFSSTTGADISDDFFTISSLGTLEDSKNLINLLKLFRKFIFSISDQYIDKTLIVEFDTGSIIHSIFHAVGFKKLFIDNDKKSLICNKSLIYNSDIYYCNNMTRLYRENYSQPLKQFIKLYGDKMREVLIA